MREVHLRSGRRTKRTRRPGRTSTQHGICWMGGGNEFAAAGTGRRELQSQTSSEDMVCEGAMTRVIEVFESGGKKQEARSKKQLKMVQ